MPYLHPKHLHPYVYFCPVMIEVFRTDVTDRADADMLTARLHEMLSDHRIHFDLDDCDHILRVEAGTLKTERVITLLETFGFRAEILPDDSHPPVSNKATTNRISIQNKST